MKINYLVNKPIYEWEDSDDMNINTIEKDLNKDIQSQLDTDFENIYDDLKPKINDILLKTLETFFNQCVDQQHRYNTNIFHDYQKFCLLDKLSLIDNNVIKNLQFNNGKFMISLSISLLGMSFGHESIILSASKNNNTSSLVDYDIYKASKCLLEFSDLLINELKTKLKIDAYIKYNLNRNSTYKQYNTDESSLPMAELESNGLIQEKILNDIPFLLEVIENIENIPTGKIKVDSLKLSNNGPCNKNDVPFYTCTHENVIELLNHFEFKNIDVDNKSGHLLDARKLGATPLNSGLSNELIILDNIENYDTAFINYEMKLRYGNQPSDTRWDVKKEFEDVYNLITLKEKGLIDFINKSKFFSLFKTVFDWTNYTNDSDTSEMTKLKNKVFYYKNPLKDLTFNALIIKSEHHSHTDCILSLDVPGIDETSGICKKHRARYNID